MKGPLRGSRRSSSHRRFRLRLSGGGAVAVSDSTGPCAAVRDAASGETPIDDENPLGVVGERPARRGADAASSFEALVSQMFVEEEVPPQPFDFEVERRVLWPWVALAVVVLGAGIAGFVYRDRLGKLFVSGGGAPVVAIEPAPSDLVPPPVIVPTPEPVPTEPVAPEPSPTPAPTPVPTGSGRRRPGVTACRDPHPGGALGAGRRGWLRGPRGQRRHRPSPGPPHASRGSASGAGADHGDQLSRRARQRGRWRPAGRPHPARSPSGAEPAGALRGRGPWLPGARAGEPLASGSTLRIPVRP